MCISHRRRKSLSRDNSPFLGQCGIRHNTYMCVRRSVVMKLGYLATSERQRCQTLADGGYWYRSQYLLSGRSIYVKDKNHSSFGESGLYICVLTAYSSLASPIGYWLWTIGFVSSGSLLPLETNWIVLLCLDELPCCRVIMTKYYTMLM